jgi:hypothetical protein
MRTAISLLFMISIAATGCKKKEADKAPEPPAGSAAGSAVDPAAGSAAGSAVDPAAGSAGSAAGSATDPAVDGAKMSKRGGNCPSMVAGVSTTASADEKAVTVTVTAADADAIASIQKRSEELLAEKVDPAAGGQHNQKGTYGGSMGLCPVGTNGATAKMEKTAKGVTIVLTPTEGTVAELKAKVDERIKASAEFVAANIKPATADEGNGGAVGGGKGDHGSNHSGEGNGKGKKGDGSGGGKGTGGGGGAGTGGGTKPDEKTK